MIKKAGSLKKIEVKNAQGGLNSIFADLILEGDEFNKAGRLFNFVTFPPNSSIGYHVHENESETYVILKGHGIYNDNGTEVEVKAGDVTVCPPGEGHGLYNNSDEDIVIVALIMFDKR